MINYWKIVSISILLVGIATFSLYGQPATAASPETTTQAQQNEVTLEKRPSAELVDLGEIYSYTITIKNNGTEAIKGTLTDPVPDILVLLSETITATTGEVSVSADNVIAWSGDLSSQEEVILSYRAIPPTFSMGPDEVVNNVATFKFGDTTLESGATVTTKHGEYGLIWSLLRPVVSIVTISLVYISSMLENFNIPYSFGFAIILFTLIVRGVTFPLNMVQIRSTKAMQEIQPKMKILQEKYKDDREALGMAQMQLYREAGVNPVGGCLPMLIQMPIWISLYWALIQLSKEGLLNQSFLWIPNLAGPVAYEEHSIGWLFPPPPAIGWGPALAYLVLPVLLVVSQLYMQQMMTPPTTDPQQAQMQQMMKFMPLMFGYFALVVPSGLTLYWFTSNILMMAQQYFTQDYLDNKKPALATSAGSVSDVDPPPISSENSSHSKEGNGKNDTTRRKSKRKR